MKISAVLIILAISRAFSDEKKEHVKLNSDIKD
jgi:hypothetical protein